MGVIRIYGVERGRRQRVKSEVKGQGATRELPVKLPVWSAGGAGGIPGVAVKCVDIRRSTGGEGGLLDSD